MKADALGEPGGCERRLEVAAIEVVVAEEPAAWRCEHEVVAVMRTLGEVGGQLFGQGARDRHRPALGGLYGSRDGR